MAAEKVPPPRPRPGDLVGIGPGLQIGEIPYGLAPRELANGTFNGLGVCRPAEAGRPPEGSLKPDPREADRDDDEV